MKKKGPTITVSFSLINLMLLMSVPVWADVPMDLKSPFPKTVIILRSGKIEYIEKAGLLKLEGDVLEVTKSNGSLAIVSKNQVLGVLPTRPEKIEERDVKAAKDAVAFLQKAQAQLPNEPVCSSQEIEKWEKEISSAKDFHAEQSKVQEQELENKRMDSHRKKLGVAKERAETRAIVESKPVGTNDPTPAPKQEVAKTTWPGLNSEKKTGKRFWANRCRRKIKVRTPFMWSSRGRIIGILIFFLKRRLSKKSNLKACVIPSETRKRLRF